MLTGRFGFGSALLLLITTIRSGVPWTVGCFWKSWIPRLGFQGWVRVHLLTVPANPRLNSKIFLKSRCLVTIAPVMGIDGVHFL